jgi:hypothetical protein
VRRERKRKGREEEGKRKGRGREEEGKRKGRGRRRTYRVGDVLDQRKLVGLAVSMANVHGNQ